MNCELFKIRNYGTKERTFEKFAEMPLKEVLTKRHGLNEPDVGAYVFTCEDVYAFDLDMRDDEELSHDNAMMLFLAACASISVMHLMCHAIHSGHGIHFLVPKQAVNFYNWSKIWEQLDNFLPKSVYVDRPNSARLNGVQFTPRLPCTFNRKLGKRPFLAYTLHMGFME